jgi:hypothetical protein
MQILHFHILTPSRVLRGRGLQQEMGVYKSAVLLGVVLASVLLGFLDVVYARELTEANGC